VPEFLAIYLQHTQRELLRLVKWSRTVQSLNKSELDGLQIPLPPLAIQRRIVADVEAGRATIVREREIARGLSIKIEADIEAYLLGTKRVGTN
jgi:hypothetical protein